MKKIVVLALLSIIVTNVTAEILPRIALVRFDADARSPVADTVSRAATDTVELILTQLSAYEIYRVDALNPYTRFEECKKFLKEYQFDNGIFGVIAQTDAGSFEITVMVYDRVKDSIVISEQGVADNPIDIFEIADEIIIKALEEFSDTHIAFGTVGIAIKNASFEYEVFVDGASVGTDVKSADVLVGRRKILIASRDDGRIVFSESVEIKEGKQTDIAVDPDRADVAESGTGWSSDSVERPVVYIRDFTSESLPSGTIRSIHDLIVSKFFLTGLFDVRDSQSDRNIEIDMRSADSAKEIRRIMSAEGIDFIVSADLNEEPPVFSSSYNMFSFLQSSPVSDAGSDGESTSVESGGVSLEVSYLEQSGDREVDFEPITIENRDVIDRKLTGLTIDFIERSLGIEDWNPTGITDGFSFDVGLSGEFGNSAGGVGISLGFLGQKGNIAAGYSTSFLLLPRIVWKTWGSLVVSIGDKVIGPALTAGIGAGWDFDATIYASPMIGFMYKSMFFRYIPNITNDFSEWYVIHEFEVGYSFFKGQTARPASLLLE